MINNNGEKAGATPSPSPPNLKIGESDCIYLKCILAPHIFKNPTLQSFMNELHDVFDDIVQRGSIENYVDVYGNFTVSVKVEREE